MPGGRWKPRPRVDGARGQGRWGRSGGGKCWTTPCAPIEELAKTKVIGKTDVSQVLRLTLLAPAVVGTIVDGRQPVAAVGGLLEGFTLEWGKQAGGAGRVASES